MMTDLKRNCAPVQLTPNTPRRQSRTWPFRFNPVNEEWQRNLCAIMGLQFVAASGLHMGGPEVTLTRPCTTHSIKGDGNCLFRTLSFIITGSEEHHTLVREAILHHMLQIAHFMLSHHINDHSSVSSTFNTPAWTRMVLGAHMPQYAFSCNGSARGICADAYLLTPAHLLNTCILCTPQSSVTGGDMVHKMLTDH